MGDLLKGKRGLVMGVANDRSIAWGIAKALAGEGAELAFTYQGDMFAERVRPLAQSVGSDLLIDVDVTNDASLDAAFGTLADRWGNLDFLVHAIAFSNKDELTGRFVDTSRENFKNSLDISCYSLIEVARRAHPLMSAPMIEENCAISRDTAERLLARMTRMGLLREATGTRRFRLWAAAL